MNPLVNNDKIFEAPLPKEYQLEPLSCLNKLSAWLFKVVLYLVENVFAKAHFENRTQSNVLKDKRFTYVQIKTGDGVTLDAVIKIGKVQKAVFFVHGLFDKFESLAKPASYVAWVSKFVE